MPLIELLNTTKLRSLGFGHDQPHGGSSPQPYVQTQIPTKKELDRPSPDFLLRGATNADPFLSTGKDLERIGKWFFQEPAKGALFIAKQTLLSRTAAATDVSSAKLSGFLNGGLYLPTSTLFQVGVSAFGLHVNKQGVNPIPTDPGAGFLQSLLSIGSQPLYGITAYQNNYTLPNVIKTAEGKLEQVALTALSVLGLNSVGKNVVPSIDIIGGTKGVVVNLTKINNFLLKIYGGRILNATFTPNVYSYSGGPGSILGLGNTEIKFATDAGGNPVRTNLTRNIGGYLPGGAIALTQDEINSSEPYLLKSDGQDIGLNTTIGRDLDFRYKLRKTIDVQTDLVPHWWGIGGSYATENRIENRTKSNTTQVENALSPINSKGLSNFTGFIPFNLGLTIDGLSGIKINQKFTVDTDFLPTNYPSTVDFLIKNISHEISNNKWYTKLESYCISKGGSNQSSSETYNTSVGNVSTSGGKIQTSGASSTPSIPVGVEDADIIQKAIAIGELHSSHKVFGKTVHAGTTLEEYLNYMRKNVEGGYGHPLHFLRPTAQGSDWNISNPTTKYLKEFQERFKLGTRTNVNFFEDIKEYSNVGGKEIWGRFSHKIKF